MTTLIILLLLLGCGLAWAVRAGKRLGVAERSYGTTKALKKINRFNKEKDEETSRAVNNAGDNPNPVRAPWLRMRKWF